MLDLCLVYFSNNGILYATDINLAPFSLDMPYTIMVMVYAIHRIFMTNSPEDPYSSLLLVTGDLGSDEQTSVTQSIMRRELLAYGCHDENILSRAHAMLDVINLMTSCHSHGGAAVQQAVVKLNVYLTAHGTAIIPSAAFRPVSVMAPAAGHSSFLILHHIMTMMEQDGGRNPHDGLVLKHGSRYLGQQYRGGDNQYEENIKAMEGFLSNLNLLGMDQDEIDSIISPLKAIITLGSVSLIMFLMKGCN